MTQTGYPFTFVGADTTFADKYLQETLVYVFKSVKSGTLVTDPTYSLTVYIANLNQQPLTYTVTTADMKKKQANDTVSTEGRLKKQAPDTVSTAKNEKKYAPEKIQGVKRYDDDREIMVQGVKEKRSLGAGAREKTPKLLYSLEEKEDKEKKTKEI